MFRRWRPSFAQIFVLSLLALSLMLGGLLVLVLDRTGDTLRQSAERQRDEAARRLEHRVVEFLDRGLEVVRDLQAQFQTGALEPANDVALERALLVELLNHPSVSEISFTHARLDGYDGDGSARLAPGERWQLSLSRWREGSSPMEIFRSRALNQAKTGFEARERQRREGEPFSNAVWSAPRATATDPTAEPTFLTPISRGDYGTLDWTDLHYAEIDRELPEPQRRAEMSVLRSLETSSNQFAGVLRVGMFTEQLAQVVSDQAADDPHQIVLCDAGGNLVAPVEPQDVLYAPADDRLGLRYRLGRPHPAITEAMTHLSKHPLPDGPQTTSVALEAAGQRYLASYRPIGHSQDWVLVVIGPESYYLRGLTQTRQRLLAWSVAMIAAVLLIGGLTLRWIHAGLRQMTREMARLGDFEFSPMVPRSAIRDVEQTLAGVERAKTALRAMGRYVPIGLVRQLYHENREPTLGGDEAQISMMFSDIADFTSISESLEADRLATALGAYLQAMTQSVHENGGIVDKYIGDSVMALWNVPTPLADHPTAACRTAVACLSATEKLFASPEWGSLPRFATRIGLHCGPAIVGHFGAPDRMSYTALGDGVNLASRLEGLNKIYGTQIIVSDSIRKGVSGDFAFRQLDVVAVKGKRIGLRIYELRANFDRTLVRQYEEALRLYGQQEFAEAAAMLRELASVDIASAVMLGRCEHYLVETPAADWDGVYVAEMK